MLSYQVYKLLHLFGLMLLFFGFGGLLIPALAGFKLTGKPKIVAYISHGIGLLLLLVAGFGLLARLQLDGIPPWIHLKLGIWLLLGLAMAFVKRRPSWILVLVILGLSILAPYAAIYKHF